MVGDSEPARPDDIVVVTLCSYDVIMPMMTAVCAIIVIIDGVVYSVMIPRCQALLACVMLLLLLQCGHGVASTVPVTLLTMMKLMLYGKHSMMRVPTQPYLDAACRRC